MKILENIKKNTILLLGITVIVLYIVLKDDFEDIVTAFARIDIKYIIAALIFFFLSVFGASPAIIMPGATAREAATAVPFLRKERLDMS